MPNVRTPHSTLHIAHTARRTQQSQQCARTVPPGPQAESRSPLLRHTIPKHSIGVILHVGTAKPRPPRVSVAFGRQRPGGNGQASKASGCRVPASRTSDLPNRVLAYAPDPNEDADDARPAEFVLHLWVDERHAGRGVGGCYHCCLLSLLPSHPRGGDGALQPRAPCC
eukprot:COSAG01_NODE_579_length_15238_cov_10.570183_4_plen_168_part_00